MTQDKLNIDVCLSPKLISNYDLNKTSIVIIDIVRASSTICTAISYQIEHLVSVEKIEEALALKNQGYLIGGERNGDKLEGFDYGNSPISFMDRKLEGKRLAITTTNGTRTIQQVVDSSKQYSDYEILIGAFVNYSKLFNYLIHCNKHVLLVCSGWKDNLSIEDTLFAGKLANNLLRFNNKFEMLSDSAQHAILIYEMAGNNIFDFIMDNSARFSQKVGQLGTDIRYCLKEDVAAVLPVLRNGYFIDYFA
jgi:2-phosphosulfolactate phosphatase